MNKFLIIAGLGNPGKGFKETRHNLGFIVIDAFQKKHLFQKFAKDKKLKTELSKGRLDEETIVLAKPLTFMNKSGEALRLFYEDFFKNEIKGLKDKVERTLLLVHDDVDIPFGKLKIVRNRGAAGHKGVESVIKSLGTKNFIRIRLGAADLSTSAKAKKLKTLVLRKFSPREKKIVSQMIKNSIKAIESLVSRGLEKTMSQYNK